MKLKEYRTATNMTQKQLAALLGVSELTVLKYEDGSTLPSKKVMQRIYEMTRGAVMPNDFYELAGFDSASGESEQVDSSRVFLALGVFSIPDKGGVDLALALTDGDFLLRHLSKSFFLMIVRYIFYLKLLRKFYEIQTAKSLLMKNHLNSLSIRKKKRSKI